MYISKVAGSTVRVRPQELQPCRRVRKFGLVSVGVHSKLLISVLMCSAHNQATKHAHTQTHVLNISAMDNCFVVGITPGKTSA